ncbi:unnamed protein product [Moneuplotes crassus]|uniref:Ion transport domain-containing protein n=1 Tax=Euplotes crassus TaxID=5936 RepID=A0AAD1XAX9_EUPCR|nr:unnamed protein product [Moneuplotes crassus]
MEKEDQVATVINKKINSHQRKSQIQTNANSNSNNHNESFMNSTSDQCLLKNNIRNNQRFSEELFRRRTKLKRNSRNQDTERNNISPLLNLKKGSSVSSISKSSSKESEMSKSKNVFSTENNRNSNTVKSNIVRQESSKDSEEIEEEKTKNCKKFIRVLFESKYSSTFFIILTFVALYLDDIRIGFIPKSGDPYIDTIMLFCFLAFLFELIYSCFTQKDYLFRFLFWLDLFALMSLIFDVYYLLDALEVTFQLPTDATDVARAGRAGRAGTRVGRLLKIVRMIRVFRVAKLYKETKRAIEDQKPAMIPIKRQSLKTISEEQNDYMEGKMDRAMRNQLVRLGTFQDKKPFEDHR